MTARATYATRITRLAMMVELANQVGTALPLLWEHSPYTAAMPHSTAWYVTLATDARFASHNSHPRCTCDTEMKSKTLFDLQATARAIAPVAAMRTAMGGRVPTMPAETKGAAATFVRCVQLP